MDDFVTIIQQPNWKLLLYDVVKSNNFNIWSIDIVRLTNLFIEKINSLKESNLLIPANALLAASILLKLKTYTLRLTSIEPETELLIPNEEDLFLNVLNLDNPIRNKEGQVSLDDLIEAIDELMNRPIKKNIERMLKEKAEVEFFVPKAVDDINFRIEELYTTIKNYADTEGCLTFTKLFFTDINNYDIVNTLFIPLLFLYQEERVNVWQDDFFSEIFIKTI